MQVLVNSIRKYKVVICDSTGIAVEEVSLPQLLSTDTSNNYEFLYAMQDILDVILDLKIGASMQFQPNRDDSTSIGFILRTF